MASQYQSLALVAIRKAVKYEPDEKKIPKYLELQGHIEASIGKNELAIESFKSALKIIKKYSDKELEDIENNIIIAIKETEKMAVEDKEIDSLKEK